MGRGQGCSILPPDAVGLGKKMGSVFPLLLEKEPQLLSFGAPRWGRAETGGLNGTNALLIPSLETTAVPTACG